ncbi:MAG: T9SS type A sorting domain-containing protein, partial [Bacteroidota bacterium]|nr:T9SS type A sorting domain-containing protein [Bacteroidota bacterium]
EIIPVKIYYSKDSYYESVDSIIATLAISEPLIYVGDSVVAGWVMKRREVNNTNIKFVLQHTDISAPQTDSLLLKVYFQAVVSKETTGMLTLDEINFNQDTTFRDCMIAALSKTDTLFVDITNQCGDSILRQILTKSTIPFKIISIRPNPAQDEIEVSVNSEIAQQLDIEIMNALGEKLSTGTRNLLAGNNTIHLDTKNLAAGVYLLRIGGVTQNFVKVK